MSKRLVKIRFQNGLTLKGFIKDVFDIEQLSTLYDFEESNEPDFVVFGPYGNDIPPKGNYIRIGYFCENIKPDFSSCEWAFGIPREEKINHPNYKRIQWHGTNPRDLVKPKDFDADKITASKTRFCNFLYSHKVAYREAFFEQLSRYKKVDAPGKSMNNMPGIDSPDNGGKWDAKNRFLSSYKFTIAFENDIYPGYQTEKLYDAMKANSIPIYCGDPFISDVFNTNSFVNVADYLPAKNQLVSNKIGDWGQMDFEDIRPAHLTGPKHKAKRKVKSVLRDFKTRLRFGKMDFSNVIERIIELDTNHDLYLQHIQQPWFNNNTVPENTSNKNRWIEIFATAL